MTTLLHAEADSDENLTPNKKVSLYCSDADMEEDENPDFECGWRFYKPKWLQTLRRPYWALLFLCFGPLLQGTMINGMLHFFISTIERRFGLDSRESGAMSSAYDVASLLCMVPVTFLGGRRWAHKPRWIATGFLVMALGSLIFISPVFIRQVIHQTNLPRSYDLCRNTQTKETPEQRCRETHGGSEFFLLYIGNFFHGVGASPVFTLAVAYIDESVCHSKSALYLGIYYTMTLLGPALGYLAGGYLVQINEDFLFTQRLDLRVDSDHPSWIGCWWMGFFVCSVLLFILAGIISTLPKELPDTARLREEKRELEEESRGEGGTVHQSGGVGGGGLRHLPKALLALFSNPTFILVCMAGCCEGALMSGIAAFLPKILENQFGLSPKYAASFLGSVILPSALAGTVFGGWTVNFCKLDLAGILNMCLICMTCAMICVPGLFIVCPTQPLVGITAPYLENENRVGEKEWRSLWSDCNKDCKCDVSRYMPVCGIDKHLYYSACFAGCTRETTESLTNCKCVGGTEEAVETWRSADCTVPCPLFPLFIVLIFCYQFFTFSVIVPGTAAVLRCVGPDWKSLGMGVQWVLVRSLGTIPGPVIIGWIIDTGCLHWRRNPCSDTRGECIVYDTYAIGRYIAAMGIFFKGMQVIFLGLAKWSNAKRLSEA